MTAALEQDLLPRAPSLPGHRGDTPHPGAVLPATVRELSGEGRVVVRVSRGGATEQREARLLQLAGYEPAEGDRVLVAVDDDGTTYVLGVLHTSSAPRLRLADGSRVEVRGEAFELRDAEDRLLVRYQDGAAEVTAPEKDLVLSAPHGRVVMRAATDVAIEAARDVTQQAGRRLELGSHKARIALEPRGATVESPRLDVRANESHVAIGKTTLVAKTIAVTANRVAQNVERYEIYAEKLVERARDSLREVSGIAESRAGRLKQVVESLYSLRTGRTTLLSKGDTSIDGEHILLG
jgi:hypothetical protein